MSNNNRVLIGQKTVVAKQTVGNVDVNYYKINNTTVNKVRSQKINNVIPNNHGSRVNPILAITWDMKEARELLNNINEFLSKEKTSQQRENYNRKFPRRSWQPKLSNVVEYKNEILEKILGNNFPDKATGSKTLGSSKIKNLSNLIETAKKTLFQELLPLITEDTELINKIILSYCKCIEKFTEKINELFDNKGKGFGVNVDFLRFTKKAHSFPEWHKNDSGTYRANIYIETSGYDKVDLMLNNKKVSETSISLQNSINKYMAADTSVTNTVLWDDTKIQHRTPVGLNLDTNFPRSFIFIELYDPGNFKSPPSPDHYYPTVLPVLLPSMGSLRYITTNEHTGGGYQKKGIYQTGPKKGKLKKGYYYMKGGLIIKK